jgi:FkbM family methyltransferase
MRNPIRRLRRIYRKYSAYHEVFPNLLDAWKYDRLRQQSRSAEIGRMNLPPVSVRVKQLGGRAVLCRPGTTDARVLWDTYGRGDQLPPNPLPGRCTVVDLGANVGYTAAHLAALYPQSRIVAVEMDRQNLDLARSNLLGSPAECRLVHAAVWSSDGEVSYGGEEAWGFRVGELDGGNGATRRAPARSLNSIFEEHGLDLVDYLKMDIEGAEAAVFEGPMEWADRVRAMRVELHPPATWERCSATLTAHGFECSRENDGDVVYLVAVRPDGYASDADAGRDPA